MHNIILCCWNMLLKCVTDVHQSAKFNTCKLQRWFSSQNRKKVNTDFIHSYMHTKKSSFNTLWTFIEWHPFLKMCVHVGAYISEQWHSPDTTDLCSINCTYIEFLSLFKEFRNTKSHSRSYSLDSDCDRLKNIPRNIVKWDCLIQSTCSTTTLHIFFAGKTSYFSGVLP